MNEWQWSSSTIFVIYYNTAVLVVFVHSCLIYLNLKHYIIAYAPE